MMSSKTLTIGAVLVVLALITACTAPGVVFVETEEAPNEVEKSVTAEIEKETEAVETTEAEKAVPPVEAVEPVDVTNPKVNEVLNQITLVQYHYDPDTQLESFTCASSGQGLNGVELDPQGPRFVGPNSRDFDLWGAAALFKVNPDGSVFLVPQQTGGKFVDPDGVEHDSYTLEEALGFFASEDALWLGAHGEAGRIAECDPQWVAPTPTPD
jgi:hypothetical protein